MLKKTNEKLKISQLIITLTIGFGGALLAWWFNMPAAPLIGSTLSVTIATFAGLSLQVPLWLRNFAFSVIGITLGAGITPHFFNDVSRWPISLFFLLISIIVIMSVSRWMLNKWFSFDRHTVALSTSPGLLSYVVSIAADDKGDITVITFLQSYRVLLTTLFLPLIIATFAGDYQADGLSNVINMGYFYSLIVIILTLMVGSVAARFALPSAFLLMGLAVNGTLNFTGFVTGGLPTVLSFIGFTITGTLIGTRFKQCKWSDVKRLVGVATLMTIVALALSAAFSAVVAQIMSMPFGQVWVAFAPGGVEAMASIALSMNYDSIYVATHHVLRIFILIGILSLWTRGKSDDKPDNQSPSAK